MTTSLAKSNTTSQMQRTNGRDVQEIVLTNTVGARASIVASDEGLRDLEVPLVDGSLRRIVLVHDDIADFGTDSPCLGTVVGRVFDQTAMGRFNRHGKFYQLPVSGDDEVHLHGGLNGFVPRDGSVQDVGRDFVVLALVSPDGDEGCPGEVSVTCRHVLTEECALSMEIEGRADATLLNMTSHRFFSLTDGVRAEEHWPEVALDFHTPAAPNQIPTGEVRSSHETPFDFRAKRRIGTDHKICFVLNGSHGIVPNVARLLAPGRDLEMTVLTDHPGLLLYTGAGLRVTPGPAARSIATPANSGSRRSDAPHATRRRRVKTNGGDHETSRRKIRSHNRGRPWDRKRLCRGLYP